MKFNGEASYGNITLDGSTFPGLELVKFILLFNKRVTLTKCVTLNLGKVVTSGE
jgi:hypothetical protein